MNDIDWSPSAEQLANITADAFQTDPFCRWILGRRDTMEYVFRKEAKGVYVKSAFCAVTGDEGAMMALPPGQKLEMSMISTANLLAGIVRKQGITAWLENSNPKNHSFYSAYVFESRGNVYANRNSPPLELMMRPAAEGAL